jgi:signal peptidase II
MATYDATPALRERSLFIAMSVLSMSVLADQLSKSWACLHAVEPRMLVPGYLAAYAVANPGCILGLGGDRAGTNMIINLLGIALTALLARIAYADRRWWRGRDCLGAALLLAGILGNTIDRLALGHVRDFLVTWALPTLAFNLADLLVVAGIALLFLARCGACRPARSGLGFPRRAAV